MIALKDTWQEQKQQRQQELTQRQQQVREILASFQNERQTKASQLRDDLSLFQLELQEDTQNFLAQVAQQRQINAEQLAQLLRQFTHTLREQTAHFLIMTTADRGMMAQQLTQELSTFHANLNTSVALLRQELQQRMKDLQADVQLLQAETKHFLNITQNHRLQVRRQLAQDLSAFVEHLQSDVQAYISELEITRQHQAEQLQTMLQQNREKRMAEMDAMFQTLAGFRAELQQFCVDLRTLVWGTSQPMTPAPVPPPVAPTVSSPPFPQSVTPPAPPSATTVVSPTTSLVNLDSGVKPAVPIAAVVTPSLHEVSLPSDVSTVSKTALDHPETLEKMIYTHIYETKGARLNEIETALQISRLQTVDALRSLIKQGLITQRDRTYLIQEDVNL